MFDAIVAHDHYNETQASNIMHSLIQGVAYLHSNGIVHRDIKPENILISRANGDLNHLKIADFGFARRCGGGGGGGGGTAMLSRVVGTPGYMAPEIGLMNYGLGVDVWSLGVICYILLCGYAPFEHENNHELRTLIRQGVVQFPAEDWDSVSGLAKDFILKMLVVDPQDRQDIYQMYQHPWLTHGYDSTVEGSPKQLVSARSALRKYQARRRLKASVNVIRAVSRMSALRRHRVLVNNGEKGGAGGAGGSGGAGIAQMPKRTNDNSPLERLSLSTFVDEEGRLSFCDDTSRLSQMSMDDSL